MVRLVSSVVLECGKNKCELGVVNREIFPPGDSPSAIGFTPQVGNRLHWNRFEFKTRSSGPLWSTNQPNFDSRLLFRWAGRKVTVNHSSSLVSPPTRASSLHQFQSFGRPFWVLHRLSTPVTAYLPLACVSTILSGPAASGSFPDTLRTLDSLTKLWNPVPRALLLQMSPISPVWSLVASQGAD